MKLGIIDYGIGNLRSVENALLAIGNSPVFITYPDQLRACDKFILPGVGAFGKAMDNLRKQGFENILKEEILVKKKKVLGLCLGMQLLMEESEEGGKEKGLGIMKGKVVPLRNISNALLIPHVGWNSVRKSNVQSSKLFQSINSEDLTFYFVHSYYCVPEGDLTCYYTIYGKEFVSAFETENIMACQFHPEKSHDSGLQVLKNFCEW